MRPETFEQFTEPVTESGCWLWIGASTKGYGVACYKGRTHYAHRLSYLFHRGEIPLGLHVCHRCDVPLCVNPAHLFVGTATDNMLDMHAKGRYTRPNLPSSYWPNAKLTDAEAAEVRSLLAVGQSTREVARRMRVSQSTINTIKSGQRYRPNSVSGGSQK